ncbi:MAG TPA: HEAT repeat domain-containing protein [Bryobacteraceae bacterium]|nr:HEAT repeat domain-containing protein [Bryobacteraceae bacterium]
MRSFVLLCAAAFALVWQPLLAQDTSGQTKKEKVSSIRDLGKRDSQAIPLIVKYLKDPDTDVREEAVKAIIKIGTQYSLDPLIEATRDNDSNIQSQAVDGLVDFYLPGYVATGGLSHTFTRVGKRIKSALSSRNDQTIDPGVLVRPDVVEAIAGVVTGGAGFEARTDAARAAGVLRGRAAVPALEKALKSKNSDLIFESLVALQKIGDTSAGPSVAFLANDFDERVQTTALETLGVLHATEAAPQIRQVIGRPRNDKVRRSALSALAMLGLPADKGVFEEYVNSKNADMRTAALEGLGRIRDPQDVPTLDKAFNNEKNLQPRLAAAFALVSEGKLDTSEFSPLRYLVNGLGLNKGSSTSQAYLQELCRRADVRKAVIKLIPDATKAEKLGLIAALAPSAGPEATAALEQLTKDPDPDVSITAARSLRTQKTRQP